MRQRLNHPRVEFKISEVPQRHHRVAPLSLGRDCGKFSRPVNSKCGRNCS